MARKVIIDKQYMLHEVGTKFYQVVRFKHVNTTTPGVPQGAFTLTNWGAQKGEPGLKPARQSGQQQIYSGDLYMETINAKAKRGYERDRLTWGTTLGIDLDNPGGPEQLDEVLALEVEPGSIGEAKRLLGIDPREVVSPSTDADTSPARKAAKAATYVPPPAAAATHEDWGDF